MPPQPGVFALPLASTHKSRTSHAADGPDAGYRHHEQHHAHQHGHQHHQHHGHHHGSNYAVAGPSNRTHGGSDEGKRERKRRELAGKLGKEMNDRRDDGRQFAENIAALHSTAVQLAHRPETSPMYMLRLYMLSIRRSAILAQLEIEEKHASDAVQTAYAEERERVEDEWKRGRDRVRERLVEGIEERRRRAREEKEGEGTAGDASIDAQSRPHITRKLRNKLGTSPPPTPLGAANAGLTSNGIGLNSGVPITTGPFTNPHSLAVDELPSPFPLPLTSTTLPSGSGGPAGVGVGGIGNGSRRRGKGTTHLSQAGVGGLGKSLAIFAVSKESEIEADLGEIRRGNKRRRATAAATMGKATI